MRVKLIFSFSFYSTFVFGEKRQKEKNRRNKEWKSIPLEERVFSFGKFRLRYTLYTRKNCSNLQLRYKILATTAPVSIYVCEKVHEGREEKCEKHKVQDRSTCRQNTLATKRVKSLKTLASVTKLHQRQRKKELRLSLFTLLMLVTYFWRQIRDSLTSSHPETH